MHGRRSNKTRLGKEAEVRALAPTWVMTDSVTVGSMGFTVELRIKDIGV